MMIKWIDFDIFLLKSKALIDTWISLQTNSSSTHMSELFLASLCRSVLQIS